jgi:hypothetical protein
MGCIKGIGERYTMTPDINMEISIALKQSPNELAICTTNPSLNRFLNPSQT